MSMRYNANASYGRAILDRVSGVLPVFGRIHVVFAAGDTANPSYEYMQEICKPFNGRLRFYTTLAAAYAAVTSNNNDVILLDGEGSHSGAMTTVAKNRVHFMGMDSGGRMNSQGTKISTPATSVAASVAVISNSGTRNTYRNIKFIQNGTNAAQVTAFHDTGEGTFVKNCSFHHNSLLTTAARSSLKFAGDTCHYEDCQIGNSTVQSNVDNVAPLLINGYARYSYFIRCTMISYSTKTTASCIDVPDADGVIGWIMFKDCSLISASKGDGATAAGTMAEAVTSILTAGYLYFDSRCTSYQATVLAEADASILTANVAAAGNSAAAGGVAVAAA